MNNVRNILIISALIIVSAIYALPHSTMKEQRIKARNYYLEASRLSAEEKNDAAYELYAKAWRTDPTFSEAANAYAILNISRGFDSLPQYHHALSLMTAQIDSFPDDYSETLSYAYIAQRLQDPHEAVRVLEILTQRFPNKPFAFLHLAEAYADNGDFENAITAYNCFEKTEGKNEQVSSRKITFMLEKGDTIEAMSEADALIASNPKDASFILLKGNLWSYLGRQDSALNYFKLAEYTDPNNGKTKIALASFYKEAGDSIEFDNKVYEALLCDSYDLEDKLSILGDYLSSLLRDKSYTKRGDDLFLTLRNQYPHEPGILDLGAGYNAAKGNWEEAAEQISYAIDLQPDNEDFWIRLMSYYIADDKPIEAITTYNRAKKTFSPSKRLTYLLAAAYTLNNQTDSAINTFGSIIHSITPKLPIRDSISDKTLRNSLKYEELLEISTLYNSIGDAFAAAKDTVSSYTAYTNALFFYSDNSMALNNYAYFLAESGKDLTKAEAMSARAIQLEPDNPTFLDTYAWILFKKGDYTMAKLYQISAIEKSKSDLTYEFLEHYGDILFMNGDPTAALEYWEKALELEPDREILKRKVKHKTFFYH